MNILIMGCGRVGAFLAKSLIDSDHNITVIDTNEDNFRRLSGHTNVTAFIGDGTVDEDLKQAGIDSMDVFLAVESRDTRNILAAQKARHYFYIPKVICRIGDPARQEMYSNLGIEVISPVRIISEMIEKALGR